MSDSGEFVVVAFPIHEYPELARYSHPTIVLRKETMREAELSADDMICVASMDDLNFTYEAMPLEKFNSLEELR